MHLVALALILQGVATPPTIPVVGSARFQIIITPPARVTIQSPRYPGRPLGISIDSGARYDPRSRTLTLSISITNNWTRPLVAPARLISWPDSFFLATYGGVMPKGREYYIVPSNADSALGTPSLRNGKSYFWRYDSLVGTPRHVGTLQPGERSRSRTIKIKLEEGAASDFTIVLHAEAQNPHVFPRYPPVVAASDIAIRGAYHRGCGRICRVACCRTLSPCGSRRRCRTSSDNAFSTGCGAMSSARRRHPAMIRAPTSFDSRPIPERRRSLSRTRPIPIRLEDRRRELDGSATDLPRLVARARSTAPAAIPLCGSRMCDDSRQSFRDGRDRRRGAGDRLWPDRSGDDQPGGVRSRKAHCSYWPGAHERMEARSRRAPARPAVERQHRRHASLPAVTPADTTAASAHSRRPAATSAAAPGSTVPLGAARAGSARPAFQSRHGDR